MQVKSKVLKNGLKLNEFWKNVAKLTSGTFLAQVTAFFCGPIITRIFSVEDYGTLGVYSSLTGTLVIIAAFRYERAILLSDKDNLKQLLNLCLFIAFCFILIVLLAISLFHPFINSFFKLGNTPFLIFLIPLSVFFNSAMNAFYALGNSYKLYTVLSISIIVNSLVSNLLKIILGYYLEASPKILILSEIAGIFCSTVFLMFFIQDKVRALFQIPDLKKMLHIAFIFKKFPVYDTFTSLINTISWLLPTFLLDYYFSKTHVGFYTLGFTMLRMPMNLIGKAVGDVFYKSAIDDSFSTDKLAETSVKTVSQLFSFGLVPTVIVLVFGPELFSFFFGAKWDTAGFYSQILAIWSLVWFISSPISTLYYVLELQNKFLLFMTASFILRLLSLIIGGVMNSVTIALVLYSIVSSFIYGYQVVYLLKKLNVNLLNVVAKIATSNVYIILTLLSLLLVKFFIKDNIIQIVAIACVGALSFLFLFRRKSKMASIA